MKFGKKEPAIIVRMEFNYKVKEKDFHSIHSTDKLGLDVSL